MVDRLGQVGLAVVLHLDRGEAGSGHAGAGALLVLRLLAGGVEAGGAPELLLELAVLALLPGELHALDQGQAPGDHGKADQQPDDGAFDGFERGG